MLVVPLLEITDENSIRFNIPHYQHPDWLRINMADALNAFLHFSFLQSNRELVFADLQGLHYYLYYPILLTTALLSRNDAG